MQKLRPLCTRLLSKDEKSRKHAPPVQQPANLLVLNYECLEAAEAIGRSMVKWPTAVRVITLSMGRISGICPPSPRCVISLFSPPYIIGEVTVVHRALSQVSTITFDIVAAQANNGCRRVADGGATVARGMRLPSPPPPLLLLLSHCRNLQRRAQLSRLCTRPRLWPHSINCGTSSDSNVFFQIQFSISSSLAVLNCSANSSPA